jgi:hypothetical protein
MRTLIEESNQVLVTEARGYDLDHGSNDMLL